MLHLPTGPQISLRFAPRPAVFELQAVSRQVHQMTSNTKRSKARLIHLTKSHISLFFSLWPVVFELQAILTQMHRMVPK